MHQITLTTVAETTCILNALARPDGYERQSILKRGLKNVIEITAGGYYFSMHLLKFCLLFNIKGTCRLHVL